MFNFGTTNLTLVATSSAITSMPIKSCCLLYRFSKIRLWSISHANVDVLARTLVHTALYSFSVVMLFVASPCSPWLNSWFGMLQQTAENLDLMQFLLVCFDSQATMSISSKRSSIIKNKSIFNATMHLYFKHCLMATGG